MRILTCTRAISLFIGIVSLFTLVASTLPAQQKIKVSGKHTLADINMNTINVGDTEDHIISLGEFEGSNVSTGEVKFMDGALDIGMTCSDVVKGNGPHHGYGNMSLNGDTIFWEHRGTIGTTIVSGGKPVTTVEGSFVWTKGTGKYEGIQGGGTYKGKYISKTIFIVEWEGQYLIQK